MLIGQGDVLTFARSRGLPQCLRAAMSRTPQLVSLSRTPKDILRFLRVSYSVYRDDPHWVAPLLGDLKRVFTDENPLFDHAEMQLWVATLGGRDVGRIAAILDCHSKFPDGIKTAGWGFFESINDPAVSDCLFKAVFDWSRSKGQGRVMGPVNPTTNDDCGLLVDGFDSAPVFMMTYNPRYYLPLVERVGFAKAKDLLAYTVDISTLPLDRLSRIAGKVRQRNPQLVFRKILKKTLEADLGKIKEVYNAAWEDNWGFIPMTDAEVDFMASRLKPLLFEGLVWLAEEAGQPVGFLLATPDYNVALKPLGGKLLTPRFLGFIPYLMGWKVPPRTRVLTLGVIEKYRGRGLEATMLIEGLKVGFEAGVKESEASWILEDNMPMRRVLESIGMHVYKTYRLYEANLNG